MFHLGQYIAGRRIANSAYRCTWYACKLCDEQATGAVGQPKVTVEVDKAQGIRVRYQF